jgi:DNA-binding NtrC family response regulator
MDKLLIIDDSIAFLNDVEPVLSSQYHVLTATSGKEGISILKNEQVTAVLLDLKLPDIYGTKVLQKIHNEIDPFLPVIIVTDYGDVEHGIEAMRLGAYDFIPKHFNKEILYVKIIKALERRELELQKMVFQDGVFEQHDKLIFTGSSMNRINSEISRLAELDSNVLITGETGTGKDLAAFQIHYRSERRDKPFISIPIGSLSEPLIESELFGHEKGAFTGADKAKIGKLEAAEGGTIYIPEISTLDEKIQIKLLSFMQYKTINRVGGDPIKSDKKVNAKIIMATNENLEKCVRMGKMREDFYYRINAVRLEIPPLRDHKEDILPLSEYFLDKFNKAYNRIYKFSKESNEFLLNHNWRGNIRELRSVLENGIANPKSEVIDDILLPEHFSILSPILSPEDELYTSDLENNISPLTQSVRQNEFQNHNSGNIETHIQNFRDTEYQFKYNYFNKLLIRVKYNIPEAAKIAGFTAQGLRKILKKLKIDL